MEAISTIFDGKNNFVAYHAAVNKFKEENPGAVYIPFSGMLARNVTFMEEANLPFQQDGKINGDRIEMLGKAIAEFEEIQNLAFSQKHKPFNTDFARRLHAPTLSEESRYIRSVQIYPTVVDNPGKKTDFKFKDKAVTISGEKVTPKFHKPAELQRQLAAKAAEFNPQQMASQFAKAQAEIQARNAAKEQSLPPAPSVKGKEHAPDQPKSHQQPKDQAESATTVKSEPVVLKKKSLSSKKKRAPTKKVKKEKHGEKEKEKEKEKEIVAASIPPESPPVQSTVQQPAKVAPITLVDPMKSREKIRAEIERETSASTTKVDKPDRVRAPAFSAALELWKKREEQAAKAASANARELKQGEPEQPSDANPKKRI